MRALLTGFGTLGDLQPLLALGRELERHGHRPLVAFAPTYRDRVEAVGLPFVPLGPDLSETQREVNLAMNEIGAEGEAIRSSWAPLAAALPQVYEELSELARNADVLISGPGLPAARMVHERQGTPFVSVQVANFGGMGSPGLRQASRELINPLRRQLGLPALSDPLTLDANSPQLALYAISRHVWTAPVDWPAHYRSTGFFFLDEDHPPEPRLVEFLERGEAPVLVSFGSTVHADAATLLDHTLAAGERAGVRLVLQRGTTDWRQDGLPSWALMTDFVPHGWLLPRCRAAVHHGGAGTTAAALRSGIPSLFVLHSEVGDQPYWAHLVHGLGCAPPPLELDQVRADSLAAALVSALTPAMRRRVETLGRRIAAESGVAEARRAIEELADRLGVEGRERPAVTDRGQALARRRDYRDRRRRRHVEPNIPVAGTAGSTGSTDERLNG